MKHDGDGDGDEDGDVDNLHGELPAYLPVSKYLVLIGSRANSPTVLLV